MKNISFLLVALLALLWGCEPTVPAELSSFQLEKGFQIELIVQEPLISDPVDMAIDEYGRMFVVEMHGYPLDVSGSGVVKRLTDTDGDGLPDKSIVFADSLVLPTGIMRWKKGWLVTDPPNVLYLEDTDEDGRADKKEVVLTGFALSNPQHNVNNPLYGLDNMIYLSHEGVIRTKAFDELFGDEGEPVHFPGKADSPQLGRNANGLAVRFRPETGKLESLGGKGQFGHSFDEWGRHFTTSNANHLYHMAMDARYMSRNTDLLIPSGQYYMPETGKGFDIFPITTNPDHQLLTDIGVITSACGIAWYKGGLFPKHYEQTVFTAEPVHNLIHVDRIREKGATFESASLLEDREFLASTDSWFRPVNHYIGPDGALYVIDYYRKVIEHPEWVSEEVRANGDLYAGSDQGRIYRITPKGTSRINFLDRLALGKMSNSALVEKLGDKNGWWRYEAQRLLMDRTDAEIPDLLKLYVEGVRQPQGKVHAMWVLEGKNALEAPILTSLLHDKHPGVRENAIRIAERHLKTNPELEKSLIALAEDEYPKVRYQLLLTLGNLKSAAADEARKQILIQDLADTWVHLAALSARGVEVPSWFQWATETLEGPEQAGAMAFMQKLSETLVRSTEASAQGALFTQLLESVGDNWYDAIVLNGVSMALKLSADFSFSQEHRIRLVEKWRAQSDSKVRTQLLHLLAEAEYFQQKNNPLFKLALARMQGDLPEAEQIEALRIIAWTDAQSQLPLIQKSLTNTQSSAVKGAALDALAKAEGRAAIDFLVEIWPELLPDERQRGLSIFFQNDANKKILLAQIKSKHIAAANLNWGKTMSLLNSGNTEVRSLAREILHSSELSSDEAWKTYEPCLTMPGKYESGVQVFEQYCGTCHQLGGKHGVAYGPDLASVQNRNRAALLLDIMQPNRAIADGYELWAITLNSGKTLAGVIANETPSTLTLRGITGEDLVISRDNIQKVQASQFSAMPEQLHQAIGVEKMADLLAFLKGEA